MPKAGLYGIFDHQQATEFFDRNAVGSRPIGGGTRLQGLPASARQLFRHPCRYSQSMGASVRLKTGVLHNPVRDKQMKANPGVLPTRTGPPPHASPPAPRRPPLP